MVSEEGRRDLYRGAVELIAQAVANADRGEIDRDEARRGIVSVLREVERHEQRLEGEEPTE